MVRGGGGGSINCILVPANLERGLLRVLVVLRSIVLVVEVADCAASLYLLTKIYITIATQVNYVAPCGHIAEKVGTCVANSCNRSNS
jgi:hypothetical protein